MDASELQSVILEAIRTHVLVHRIRATVTLLNAGHGVAVVMGGVRLHVTISEIKP